MERQGTVRQLNCLLDQKCCDPHSPEILLGGDVRQVIVWKERLPLGVRYHGYADENPSIERTDDEPLDNGRGVTLRLSDWI